MTGAYWVEQMDNAAYSALRAIAAAQNVELVPFGFESRLDVPLLVPPILTRPLSAPPYTPDVGAVEKWAFLAAWAARVFTRATNAIVVCVIGEPSRSLTNGLVGIGAVATTCVGLTRFADVAPPPLSVGRLWRLLAPHDAVRAEQILHDLGRLAGLERAAALSAARAELRIDVAEEQVESRLRALAKRPSSF